MAWGFAGCRAHYNNQTPRRELGRSWQQPGINLWPLAYTGALWEQSQGKHPHMVQAQREAGAGSRDPGPRDHKEALGPVISQQRGVDSSCRTALAYETGSLGPHGPSWGQGAARLAAAMCRAGLGTGVLGRQNQLAVRAREARAGQGLQSGPTAAPEPGTTHLVPVLARCSCPRETPQIGTRKWQLSPPPCQPLGSSQPRPFLLLVPTPPAPARPWSRSTSRRFSLLAHGLGRRGRSGGAGWQGEGSCQWESNGGNSPGQTLFSLSLHLASVPRRRRAQHPVV